MKNNKSRNRSLGFLFFLILVLFILYCAFLFLKHDEPPVININSSSDVDEFSVNLTDEDLMVGVTASDREDGDVTDSIIIEDMSQLDSDETRTVTYVAFDSGNNVTKVMRKIRYTDYHKPEIVASDDLTFPLGVTEKQILSHFKCVDVIDGDISSRITMHGSDLQTTKRGLQTITVMVTNSCGDSSYASFDITIRAEAADTTT